MWLRIECRMLAPAILTIPVPFDEVLGNVMLRYGDAVKWEEAIREMPVEFVDGVSLASMPFFIGNTKQTTEYLTRTGNDLLYGEVLGKKKVDSSRGSLKAYRREIPSVVVSERVLFFVKSLDPERLYDLIWGRELWIGKKYKFGFGRLELEDISEAGDEVEGYKVHGHTIRPLPRTLVPDPKVAVYMRKHAPYWKMDEAVMDTLYTNVADYREAVLGEVEEYEQG